MSNLSKATRRHVTITAANPDVDIPACLGKVEYASEEEARARSSFEPYKCAWGDHWHTTSQGFKGARRGR